MKKFLVIILVMMCAYVYAGHKTKSFLIQFATDEHALDPEALKKLSEVTEFLKMHPSAKIKLTGRTDFEGTIGYNVNLSRRRTTQVSEYLKIKGWQNAEIDEKWLGELKPLASNANDNGKALNRSVEIVITVLNYANAKEWIKEQQQGYEETFKLSSSGKNTITTENQTLITIPSGAFTDASGAVVNNKNVNVVVKEVNTMLDAILNQVYTMSGDKLLETGGMINIEAYNNSTQLQLAEGKEINIQIPARSNQTDMFVFEGVADKNGTIDWKNTQEPFETNAQRALVSQKLNEDILLTLIKGIDLKKPVFTDMSLSYKLPAFVHVPSKPTLPKLPQKIDARKLFSTLGWILSTRKMKENRVEKVHKKNMDEYNKRMVNYDRRLKRYETAILNRKAEIEKFEAEKELFYNWMRKTISSVNSSIENIFDAHDKVRAYRGLVKLYYQSKNGTQYSNTPLKNLRTFARSTRLSDEETMKLEYLLGIKRSLVRFQTMEYPHLVKKYARDGKLRITKVARSEVKNEILSSERLWNNKFLDDYVIENKEAFKEVFGNEMDEQLKSIERQKIVSQKNESQMYFTGNSKKMGWINCDRYVARELVTVAFNSAEGAYQVVILKDINSILSPNYYNTAEGVSTASVPRDSDFNLVTLKIEGDQAYISIIEATARKGLKLEPEFRKVPVEEANKILAKL